MSFNDVAWKLTTHGLTGIAGMKPAEIAAYIDDLEVMPQLQKSSILEANEDLWFLVAKASGDKKLRGIDKRIWGIIENSPEEIQVRVLAKNRMIWSLCYSGHAAEVVRLIERMNEKNQKRLFDVRGAVPALLIHNQEDALERIKGTWPPPNIPFRMPKKTAPTAG